MDFLTWQNAGLAALIALGLVTLVVVAKLFRKGLGTYDERHKSMERRIRQTEAEMRECNKAMPASEQLTVLLAALEEMLDLEGRPHGFAVERLPCSVALATPEGRVVVAHSARTSVLRGSKRVLHGAGRWEVRGPGEALRCFEELATLMRYLTCMVRGEESPEEELVHFQRRIH